MIDAGESNAPVLTLDQLAAELEEPRRRRRTVAFANGVFDLLHVGHVRYLQDASRVADILVVAVNSDASVRVIKGEGRPLTPEGERAEIVAAIRGVDYVTLFGDESVERLLLRLRPEYHCKGTDYTVESVPEAAVVASYGGKVVIVGDPKDHSTSSVIEALRQGRA
jgi:D-glycero-beta-D-manno-heptose 1-phosphate adenylyltransferase